MTTLQNCGLALITVPFIVLVILSFTWFPEIRLRELTAIVLSTQMLVGVAFLIIASL